MCSYAVNEEMSVDAPSPCPLPGGKGVKRKRGAKPLSFELLPFCLATGKTVGGEKGVNPSHSPFREREMFGGFRLWKRGKFLTNICGRRFHLILCHVNKSLRGGSRPTRQSLRQYWSNVLPFVTQRSLRHFVPPNDPLSSPRNSSSCLLTLPRFAFILRLLPGAASPGAEGGPS